jgi:hypothetical protein
MADAISSDISPGRAAGLPPSKDFIISVYAPRDQQNGWKQDWAA